MYIDIDNINVARHFFSPAMLAIQLNLPNFKINDNNYAM